MQIHENIGITNSSGLMPLSRIRDNGILNNMPEPAKTTPAPVPSPPGPSSIRDEEERDSVLEQLRRQKEAEHEEKKSRSIFHSKDSQERSME